MQNKDCNLHQAHYDKLYNRTDVDQIVAKITNLKEFLDDAILTDTSWHGFYLNDFANRIKGKKIFEIGCGDGLNALIMAVLGADVIANDISGVSGRIIHDVSSRMSIENIRFVDGDFRQLSLPLHSFDFVVGKAFLHHLTHDLESTFLKWASLLLKRDGEARFFEPAINSQCLDSVRWIVPVPGRPSSLNTRAFSEWKKMDPHPDRDNSSDHYKSSGERFFLKSTIVPIGSIERFSRLMPRGSMNRKFRRWAHRLEPRLPLWFRYKAARSQLIIYEKPALV